MPPVTVFMFPGQSSLVPGMLERATHLADGGARLLRDAAEVLGQRVESPLAGAPRSNWQTQVSVFLCTLLHLRAVQQRGIAGDVSCGMSLGEYAHLVHIGALQWTDALRLVSARGRAYDAGPRGQMLTVFPVTEAELAALLPAARQHGRLFVSNHNSPTQHVLAGDAAAIAWAAAHVRDDLCGDAVLVEPRLPMHCELFAPVAPVLQQHLRAAPWRSGAGVYLPNVDAVPLPSPTPADLVDRLTRHVTHAVCWRQSMERLRAMHPDARFVEVGPGRVLHNLLRKPWMPVARHATDHDTTPTEHFESTMRALRHAH
ncbi:MAG: ACP S-malonyltransferase [Gemmatimonadaceae bacterium]|nr:ACP S-malonyltransferase [Gemmatimonadaceae bacterium]